MAPQNKLRIANVLMLAGILPLILGVSWICAVMSYAQQHKGEMGGSDAFLMIGVLAVTYAFALLVGGAGALWSTLIARRHAGLRTKPATIIRTTVAVFLLAPLLWYFAITFRLL